MRVAVHIGFQEIDLRGVQQMTDTHKPAQNVRERKRERERQNGSCPVKKGRSEGVKVVRNRLMWEARLPPKAVLASGSGLLTRTMSGSVALLQLRSVLMSVVPVITEGHKDVWGLGRLMCHVGAWGPCHHRGHRCKWPALPSGSTEASRLKLLLRAMSGSVVPPQPGSVLKPVAPSTTEGCAVASGLGYQLGPFWSPC